MRAFRICAVGNRAYEVGLGFTRRLETAPTKLAWGSYGDGVLPQNLIVQLNAEPRLR